MAGIVGYASSKLSEKVGNGQCTDLVEGALEQAGKKTTQDFGVTGKTDDYKWGVLLASKLSIDKLSEVRPGDIIQFRNHTLRVTTEKKNGAKSIKTEDRPHHTAIVANAGVRWDDYRDMRVKEGRKFFLFTILEQNQQGKKVTKAKIQFQNSLHEMSNGDVVTIESFGDFWIYRPVSA